jgi:hypothetical protein
LPQPQPTEVSSNPVFGKVHAKRDINFCFPQVKDNWGTGQAGFNSRP